ncbi:MAG TPA: efflux transporter outer membrane subunit [Rhodocyclaceae bacterium]|jgi:multidrug efflux system outer membrane protein|nr:efflux transporter outer membrane subunit [Rhodocyclaceae bacterium]
MNKHSMTGLSLSVLTAAVLSACSLAPDYTRPDLAVENQWPVGVNAAGERKVTDLDWHDLFPDPRLQAVIELALTNNRDLRIALARVEEARGLYGVQRADRFPGADLSIGRTGSRTPANVAGTAQDLKINRYDGNLNLLSFELDFWGRVTNLSEAARASYLASEENRRTVQLGLISDTANAYLTLQEMEERATLARETVATRNETRKLVALRREVGVAGDLDYLTADGALETAKADLANIERQRLQAATALGLLVGSPLPKDLPAARPLIEQDIAPNLAADLPSDVLLRRPDVKAAEQQLIAANANIGAARAAFLPKIVLTGAFGSASPLLNGLFKGGTESWSFTPSIHQPLFDWGRNSGNLDVAEARKVIAVATYEKTIQTAFKEVADLLAARDTLIDQLKAQDANRKSQDERLRLTDARFKAGIASNLELLDAQRDSFTAQQNAVQVRRQLLSTTAQLYKALGGSEERRKES